MYVCLVCGLLCDVVRIALNTCCFVFVRFVENVQALCVMSCVVLRVCDCHGLCGCVFV